MFSFLFFLQHKTWLNLKTEIVIERDVEGEAVAEKEHIPSIAIKVDTMKKEFLDVSTEV